MMTSYMVCSIFRGLIPRPVLALPWGSRSTTKRPEPKIGQRGAQVDGVVVFPTPPF